MDPNTVDALHPGVVTSENLKDKLSKQLKIDLEDDEPIHIYYDSVSSASGDSKNVSSILFSELNDNKIQSMVDEFVTTTGDKCQIKIRRLGDYLAKITLKGGYAVPLRFTVLQRS